MKTWQELLIFASALILIAGIAWVIVADARKNAPQDKHTHAELQASGNELSAKEREQRRRAARAKTRAQKRARKANRPH